MSDEKLTASNYSITQELRFYGTKRRVEFNERCLKQDKARHDPRAIVNIYILYEISKNYNISNYPTLKNCLFGAVSLTENADFDQYKILAMILDLIEKQSFYLVMDLVDM